MGDDEVLRFLKMILPELSCAEGVLAIELSPTIPTVKEGEIVRVDGRAISIYPDDEIGSFIFNDRLYDVYTLTYVDCDCMVIE